MFLSKATWQPLLALPLHLPSRAFMHTCLHCIRHSHIAAACMRQEINARLPPNGAAPNWTPLHLVVNGKDRYDQHPDMVRLLAQQRADMDKRLAQGQSALHLAAASHAGVPVLRALIENRASPLV